MIFKETNILENAYKPFGNVMYVDHWFKAKCFKSPMQIAPKGDLIILNKSKSRKTGKPFWWLPCIQLECKKYERLSMKEDLTHSLITVNKRYLRGNDVLSPIQLDKLASQSPNKDWRIEIIYTFESFTYQRQGRKKWLLIEIGKGFA